MSGNRIFTTIPNAIKLAGELPKKSYYIRFDVRDFKPGDKLPRSYRWVDGDQTNRLLAGTCVINPNLDYTNDWFNYSSYQGHVYIVRGKVIRKGQDFGEVILKDAVIVKKLTGRAAKPGRRGI